MKDPYASPPAAAHVHTAQRSAPAHAERIAVSGMGLVTPLGNTLADFDDALFAGRSAVRAQTLTIGELDAMQVSLASCNFDDSERSSSRLPLDRGTAMALAAARAAVAQAGLDTRTLAHDRVGVYWGSGMAGSASFDATARALYAEHRRVRPTTVLTTMPNAAAAELGLLFSAQGAALSYACACASSSVAIGEAMRAIRGGWIDVAIVGGHEAQHSPGTLASWHAMRVMAPPPADAPERACRPFSADRAGFALGEGAAALVIESQAHARARGASSSLSLAGYATNCDGSHMTNPDPAGQVRVMLAALKDAGLRPEDIGYINAHGTATGAGDAAEAASLQTVFGSRTPVSSTKAVHGHLLGGGGAVELVATLRALERGLIPPTAHLHTPDPAFALDLVRGQARDAAGMRYALSNSFAFGGTNAVLVAACTH
ncbi:beta-ketoacyl-[acyl-carrier-protein] synthase family protein [Variovorax ginsengisoli]|uniref:Nodulation protein E n=1 Tax=Variovorax ginsengisoli TaxID=363844 RepID=A0ABT9S5M8_9BURK|nr:beta-ketoacyl-[acyl-carrier-protein] synthase family protein [Variovorax ginsengisoli]MDP9899670.1 3-oxoacyl-[acyl-carrier-protein] synthase II [Variovorax ginsengisoli]